MGPGDPQEEPRAQATPRGSAAEPQAPPLPAFETWRLDYSVGAMGPVRVSEFADFHPLPIGPDGREAYGRPANKRDLGHRCHHCRRPFSSLGAQLVAELHGGPDARFHPECWELSQTEDPRGRCERPRTREEEASGTLVSAYEDEWRRVALQSRSLSSRSLNRSASARRSVPSIMEGMNTFEDSSGEKHVARGFTQREVELAVNRWGSDSVVEECAVCLSSTISQPLQLPCGHGFCTSCLEPWLRRCGLCPMCRQDLRPHLGPARSPQPSPLPGRLRLSASASTGFISARGIRLRERPEADEHREQRARPPRLPTRGEA